MRQPTLGEVAAILLGVIAATVTIGVVSWWLTMPSDNAPVPRATPIATRSVAP